ncbi:MAG: hypothetical protein RIS35_1144 [Pseudomonadota bacterium]|jgi:DNA processing protein
MPLSDGDRPGRAGWLRLALTPGIGPMAMRELLERVGAPGTILSLSHVDLTAMAGRRIADALAAAPRPDAPEVTDALDWASAPDHHLLTIADPAYPERLRQIDDPPPLLYVRGDPARLARPGIAVVGSRSASQGGAETAGRFARALADSGLSIVSGLARGIDAAAHRGALGRLGGTVAVLGTGVDLVYPPSNRALAEAILADGGTLVSEQPLGAQPLRANFPRRNRLIAGLSMGVLVVEAALRSGSLITARLAGDFGRDVFAVPGSIHSALSRGCHALIKDGAKLAEDPDDILSEIACAAGAAAGGVRPEPAPDGMGVVEAVPTAGDGLVEAIGWDPVSPERIALRWPLEPGRLAARLLELEFAGRVERLADGRYRRRPEGPGTA